MNRMMVWSLLVLWLQGRASVAEGAEFTILMSANYIDKRILAINTGDTVKWQADSYVNWISNYDDSWSSPMLTNAGANYTVTFGTPGFVAYRTGSSGPGTITILGWTNQAPAVTINAPVDGFQFGAPQYGIQIDASCEEVQTNIARIDFLANSNVVGTVMSPPFRVVWSNSTAGQSIPLGHYILQTKLTDRHGTVSFSNIVGVDVRYWSSTPLLSLFQPRILRNGSFMCYYSSGDGSFGTVAYYTNLPSGSRSANPPNGNVTPKITGDGIIVDCGASTNSAQRFYMFLGTGL